jgi:conjugal transfer/entry exclusion protein
MAEKARVVKTTYTKEDGSTSDRILLGSISGSITALDVTDLSEAQQTELQTQYTNWLAQQGTFKAFLESQGRADLAQNLKWRSFKQSGLGAL